MKKRKTERGRFSSRRKAEAVLRLLRGEDLDLLSRELKVTPSTLSGWRTAFLSAVPPDFSGRWVEPFMGSGVVAFNRIPKRALLADSNPHVIRFFRAIESRAVTALRVRSHLTLEGQELLRSEGEHYYSVRDRFNKNGDPLDFLFLNRSCFNGLMRFNRRGGFNVPFCRKPARFSKAYVSKIANQVQAVSNVMRITDFEFRCQGFQETLDAVDSEDLVYCDPPYVGRHSDYFNSWGMEQERILATRLSVISCGFLLSTWHSNAFRENDLVGNVWSRFRKITKEHHYHIGALEKNRNAVLEALITNMELPEEATPVREPLESGTAVRQLTLF